MASISTSVVRVEAAPYSDWEDIDFDLIADDVEDYYFIYDTGNNATALDDSVGFYRKSGGGSLLDVTKVGTAPSVFYEDKAHRFSADDTTTYGEINNSFRAVTVAHFGTATANGGYEVVAPADTGERKLVIYGALYAGDASHMGFEFNVTLNDGSGETTSTDLDAISGMVSGSDQYWRAEITYTADSDSSTITAEARFNVSAGGTNTVAVQVAGGYVTTQEVAAVTYDLAVTPATFSYTGNNADLTLLVDYSLEGTPASYAYTGNSAGTDYNRVVDVTPAAYSYTGIDAIMDIERELQAQPASFTYTGNDAMLAFTKIMEAQPATFSYTGNDASLERSPIVMDTTPATFSYTGVNADVHHEYNVFTMDTTPAAFSYAGANAYLEYSEIPPVNESVFLQFRRKGRR